MKAAIPLWVAVVKDDSHPRQPSQPEQGPVEAPGSQFEYYNDLFSRHVKPLNRVFTKTPPLRLPVSFLIVMSEEFGRSETDVSRKVTTIQIYRTLVTDLKG